MIPHPFDGSSLQTHIVYTAFFDEIKWIFDGATIFEFYVLLNFNVTNLVLVELLMI